MLSVLKLHLGSVSCPEVRVGGHLTEVTAKEQVTIQRPTTVTSDKERIHREGRKQQRKRQPAERGACWETTHQRRGCSRKQIQLLRLNVFKLPVFSKWAKDLAGHFSRKRYAIDHRCMKKKNVQCRQSSEKCESKPHEMPPHTCQDGYFQKKKNKRLVLSGMWKNLGHAHFRWECNMLQPLVGQWEALPKFKHGNTIGFSQSNSRHLCKKKIS